MSWQRRARAGLAVAGLAAAAAVFLIARDRPEPAPVSLEPSDRLAVKEGGTTTSLRLSGAFEDVRISADSWKEYEDGSVFYTNARIEFPRDGVTVRAGEMLARGREAGAETPAELELNGDVEVLTGDGLELRTDSAVYQAATGLVTMPDAVELVKGRLTATGVGGVYERQQELFRILDQARLVVAPAAEDGEAADATSRTMTMAQAEQFVRLEGDARIVRPSETMTSQVATIYFTGEQEDIRQLDLRGGAAVVPAEGAENPPPEMRGEDISMSFRPEQHTLRQATLTGGASLALRDAAGVRTIEGASIDVRTGEDGRALIGLDARDDVVVRLPAADGRPARTIRAPALSATGADGQGLQAARFTGGVEFEEDAAGGDTARIGRSRVLVLQLDGGFESIGDAEFLEQARFDAGELTAAADRAVYRAAADVLELYPAGAPGTLPHAESGRLSIDARAMTLGLTDETVTASGDVRTLMRPDPANADRPSALFSPDSPVVGSASAFEYSAATERAVYTGTQRAPARLLQDDNEVAGLTITVDEAAGDMTASGDVLSVFAIAPPEDAAADAGPTLYRIRADALDYREAERLATYTGAPVTLRSGEAESEAAVVRLTVAEDNREVELVEWQTGVFATLEGGYEAKGESLRYDVASGQYRLQGRPAETKLPSDDAATCVWSRGLLTIFNRRTGEASWPGDANRGVRVSTDSIPCGKSIR